MGLHRCPDCGNRWNCLALDCDDEGIDSQCQICSGKEMDCDPYTRIGYKGAFNDWVKQNK